MNGKFILDTNIIIALFEDDNNVKLNISKAKMIFLPSIVIGELFYGAYNSGKQKKNIEKIIKFCGEIQVLSCDYITATIYGKIKKQLKEIGKPIPENDIWIAAISIQNNIPLVTKNKHLSYIGEIELIEW